MNNNQRPDAAVMIQTMTDFMALENAPQMFVKGYMHGVLDREKRTLESESPHNNKSA